MGAYSALEFAVGGFGTINLSVYAVYHTPWLSNYLCQSGPVLPSFEFEPLDHLPKLVLPPLPFVFLGATEAEWNFRYSLVSK